MPKFSETERHNIELRLMEEGERLFTVYGLKKVTIDDIVESVRIAKASFYRFYEGKEYLYLDIVQKRQLEIFHLLEKLLESNETLPNRERVKQVFAKMSELLLKYPVLSKIDAATMDIISRKISKERLLQYQEQNRDAVVTMKKYGISFTYSTELVSEVFQALYIVWTGIQGKDGTMQNQVIDILLNGVIEQVVNQ